MLRSYKQSRVFKFPRSMYAIPVSLMLATCPTILFFPKLMILIIYDFMLSQRV